MTAQSTAVTAGHGDNTASTGAKKKPVPMYQAEPARSDVRTKRSQRGIGASAGWALAHESAGYPEGGKNPAPVNQPSCHLEPPGRAWEVRRSDCAAACEPGHFAPAC